MWKDQYVLYEWLFGFFRLALSHETMENFFKTNFLLMQEHKYNLTEIESWVPWEREVYVSMLIDHLKKKADKQRKQ